MISLAHIAQGDAVRNTTLSRTLPGALTKAFISEWIQPQLPGTDESQRLGRPRAFPLYPIASTFSDQLLENVLAIGYNGNARGLPNRCDSSVPGSCGCIHSEMNALVKAPGSVRDKVVFISASPCVMCAKLIINSGVTHVFYRKAYRDPSGIEVLQQGGVVPPLTNPLFVQHRDDPSLLEHLDARGVAVRLPVECVRHARVDDQLRAHHAGGGAHEHHLVAYAARGLHERVHLRMNAPTVSRHR